MTHRPSFLHFCAKALTGLLPVIAFPVLAADRIEPGPQDTRDYLCNVSQINWDGSGGNLWTRTARGGKFQAVSARQVRVVSSSPEAAARELYGFYQVTAPQYQGIDRGKSAQKYVWTPASMIRPAAGESRCRPCRWSDTDSCNAIRSSSNSS